MIDFCLELFQWKKKTKKNIIDQREYNITTMNNYRDYGQARVK